MNLGKMLMSHIGIVLKQALTTFGSKNDMFPQNLEILKSLLDKTTAEDVNLHPQLMTEEVWKRGNKAPVTYIDLYEDCNITMGIFVLKPGMKLPLHNHPQMHGLIKVIAGKLRITSYSLNTEKVKEFRKEGSSSNAGRYLTVERVPEDVVDERSNCCILEPESRNLHEVESIDGPAAFIDILSPPYDADNDDGERSCRYYSVLKRFSSNLFLLRQIRPPSWYWSDSFPYTGPCLQVPD